MGNARVGSYPAAWRDRLVLRFLGYQRDDQPDPRTAARLAALRETAGPLIQGRAAWLTFTREELPEDIPLSPRTERVSLALCTVGEGGAEASTRARARGEALDGVILDAIGSAAVEAVADAVEQVIRRVAGDAGYLPGRRVSPGYGKWPVAGQRDMFSLLPAAEAGIELLPSLMMKPQKSISFLVAWRRDPGQEEVAHGCRACSQSHCRSREEPSRDENAREEKP